jgi:hypothetical protein
MKKLTSLVCVAVAVVVCFCGCDTARELVNMFNCTFERENIEKFRFAGVNFDRLTSPADLTLTEGINIAAALAKGTAPISFTMNLTGKNPNKTTAGIEQFKWIFLLDGNEVLDGNVIDKYSIPAEGASVLPLEIGFDAMKYLDGSTPESIFRFYQNITGKNAAQQSNASLKIKPTINGVEFPNYITVN